MMNHPRLVLFLATILPLLPVAAADPADVPKPVPSDRRSMLDALEALKHREARLPFPQLSDAQDANSVNNGRMRRLYLPDSWTGGRRTSRYDDLPGGYDFATQLFWVVSRVNNCHYCLGHQESKLRAVGMDEASLTALDSDWSRFTENQRVAFEFARKLTFSPHDIGPAEIAALQEHFEDRTILQIVYLIGRYNATNRWTDSIGIPQETGRDFSSQIPLAEATVPSTVAVPRFPERPQLPEFDVWQERLAAARKRKTRLDLNLEPATVPSEGERPRDPIHLRLLAAAAGPAASAAVLEAYGTSEISAKLKQMIAFSAAAEDGAWYMQAHALAGLQALGMKPKAIHALAVRREDAGSRDAERAAVEFAAVLTRAPLQVHDGHISELRQYYSPHQIAEIVHHVGIAALLNRLTEATGVAPPPG